MQADEPFLAFYLSEKTSRHFLPLKQSIIGQSIDFCGWLPGRWFGGLGGDVWMSAAIGEACANNKGQSSQCSSPLVCLNDHAEPAPYFGASTISI